MAKLVEKGAGVGEAVVAGIVIGAALGAFNGFLVAKLKLPSFLVTLGTMAAYRGAAQAMLGSEGIKLPAGFKGIDQSYIAGLPWPLLILILLAAITGVLLHGTVLGRWVFALGTNESASRYSGVPVDRVKVLSFALMGLLCGVAALLADSRLAVARHDIAAGIELDAITVAVVGGTAISGGVGSILGTVLSLFLIGVIKTGMGVAGVKAEYQLTVIGVLLIGAALSGQIATWAFSRVRRIEPGKT